MLNRHFSDNLPRRSAVLAIVVGLIALLVGALISLSTGRLLLSFTGMLLLVPLLTSTPVYSVLGILWGFSLFPFLVLAAPELSTPQYTIVKDVFYIVLLVMTYARHARREDEHTGVVNLAFVLATIYAIILALYWLYSSTNHAISLVSLRNHLEFVPLIIVIPLTFHRKADVTKTILGILFLIDFLAIVHIIDFGLTYDFVFARGVNRVLLGSYNPNVLGTLYALGFATALTLIQTPTLFAERKGFGRMLLFGTALVTLFALTITLSRRNIVALVIAIPVGFLMINRSISLSKRIALLVITGALLLTLYDHAPETVRERVESIIVTDVAVDASRIQELTAIRQLLIERPSNLFLGTGFGSVGSSNLLRGRSLDYYHNYYVQILFDSGLPGLLSLLLLIAIILTSPFIVGRSGARDDPMVAVLFQGLLIVLIGNLFGTTLGSIPINVIFWSYGGLLLCIISLQQKSIARKAA